MVKLLREYAKVIGFTFTGLVFGAAFFLLFINFYHYKDVTTTISKSDTDTQRLQDVKNKLQEVRNITDSFNPNVYSGPKERVMLMTINSKLQLCLKAFDDENLNKYLNQKEMNIKDVYYFKNNYQSTIVNGCVVTQLYELGLTGDEEKYHDSDLRKVAPFIKLDIDTITEDNTFVTKAMENNSSYFFSSDNAKLNFELTRDSYYEVYRSYLKSVDLVYNIAKWFQGII